MEEKTIKDFVEQSAEAILSVDEKGLIEFWNYGAEKLFGFTKSEALFKSLDIIIPEKHRSRHWEAFYRVMETGKSKYEEGHIMSVPAIDKDGQRIIVEFSVTMIFVNGKIKHCFSILRHKKA